jgi:hypothetical protein
LLALGETPFAPNEGAYRAPSRGLGLSGVRHNAGSVQKKVPSRGEEALA